MSDPADASGRQADDVLSRGYKHDPRFMEQIARTKCIDELDVAAYDALVIEAVGR